MPGAARLLEAGCYYGKIDLQNLETLFYPPELVGIREAERDFGQPLRRNARLVPSRTHAGGVYTYGLNRDAEIVMILPRPGGILLHRKEFYPEGAHRLLTGGVDEGESVVDAARREVREETGFSLQPERFLFHLRYPGKPGAPKKGFHSLGFLFPYTDGEIRTEDLEEKIESWDVADWPRFPDIILQLEDLNGGWLGWGRFRALAHSFLLECRGAHPEWF